MNITLADTEQLMTKIANSIVKDSKELRATITLVMAQKKLTGRKICSRLRLEQASFSRYINHGNVEYSMSEQNVLRVCKHLKIDVKLIIEQK